MKYNLGCGNQYLQGWVNVDQFPQTKPDLVMDLEKFPWPIEDNSADEILLSHVLEHIGGHSSTFLGMMKELYRICKPGAKVIIRVPDPRHDDFLSDPTHQRAIIPGMFQTFDLMLNEIWVSHGLPGTPLGKYLGIDFATASITSHLDSEWESRRAAATLDASSLAFAQRSYNNVSQWWEIILVAQKPFTPGRSLRRYDALVIQRWGGMGDVLMALSAAAAIKASVGTPIFLHTSPELAELAKLSPSIDGVFCDAAAVEGALARIGASNPRVVDWAPVQFGISRFHQVDAYLMFLGLTLPDASKGLKLTLPDNEQSKAVKEQLKSLPEGAAKIVLHPGATDPNRTWPQTFWMDLTDRLLAAGHAVVVIGATNSTDKRGVISINHPAVLDLTDHLDYIGTLHLLRNCNILISNDSGPIQLAGASDIGIVGLYSVASGDCRLPYRNGSCFYKAVAIKPECALHPCYPKINDMTLVNKFCTENGITTQNLPTLFGKWCINSDKYCCTNETAAVGKVIAAVGDLVDWR